MDRGKKTRSNRRPELSRLELSVMGVVWELGECSSAEVVEAFQRERDLAPTTIRTVLANLRKKGYLEPVPTTERGFRLRPMVGREVVAKRSLSALLPSLFGGSPGRAIACLLKDESLSDQELDEIRRMVESHTKKGAD